MRLLLRVLSLLTGKQVLPPEETHALSAEKNRLANQVQALETLLRKKEAEQQQHLLRLEAARQTELDAIKESERQLTNRLQTLNARYNTLAEQSDSVSLRHLQENEALLKQLNWLSGTIAHDFRAPLRAIDANCFFLEGDLPAETSEETRKLLDEIQRNGKRMGVLIDGLLDYLRVGITPLNEKPIDVCVLINELIGIDYSLTRSPIKVSGVSNLNIIGDANLLQRAFKELVDNAVKFSGPVDKPEIEVEIQPSGSILIKDNGVGFNEAHTGQLLQLFHRLHGNDEFDGEGIGLCVAQRIAQRHGGDVTLQRVDNTTIATITLALPVSNP